MTKYEIVMTADIPPNWTDWFKEQPLQCLQSNPGFLTLETYNQIDGLPEWNELSDYDKGAIVWFLNACESEGDAYARDNYPIEFRDNPILTELDETYQLDYILDRWESTEDLELNFSEELRLHELYGEN